jgi:serine/threonine-protein kinase
MPSSRRVRIAGAGIVAVMLAVGSVGWISADRKPDDARASGVVVVPTGGPVSVQCTVDYAVRQAVDGRSSTVVTVVNTGTAPVADWQPSHCRPSSG